MRILEVESVYPSPVVGESVLLRTKAYQLGHAGVQSIAYSERNGFVVVTGARGTVEVPVAWLRLGEPVAAVKDPHGPPEALSPKERDTAAHGASGVLGTEMQAETFERVWGGSEPAKGVKLPKRGKR